jgi:hypothetical protein
VREIKTKSELQDMIREAAELCEDCQDCEFGEIFAQEPDESGCNWNVSAARGEGRLACMTCLQPAATELRKEYNLIDQRFTEALNALFEGREEVPIPIDVAQWLVERGLARAQSRAGDSKFGALAITEEGRSWLKEAMLGV